jgi:hypothetical protein
VQRLHDVGKDGRAAFRLEAFTHQNGRHLQQVLHTVGTLPAFRIDALHEGRHLPLQPADRAGRVPRNAM